ncbi:MAG TPA: hypothetical protein VI685_17360, partial [Candidatus Angelobacter sp.]
PSLLLAPSSLHLRWQREERHPQDLEAICTIRYMGKLRDRKAGCAAQREQCWDRGTVRRPLQVLGRCPLNCGLMFPLKLKN